MSSLHTWLSFLHGGGSHFSSDVIVLVLIFIFFCIFGLYFGRSQAVSLILSFYPAEFLYQHFPFMSKFMLLQGSATLQIINSVLIFLIFLFPIDIIISKFIFTDSGYGTSTHYFRIIGLALCLTALVLLFTYSIVNLDAVHNFSPTIDALFASPERLFFWNAGPFVLLFFL